MLIINSKADHIVFKGKAVLMLPPLKPFIWLIDNSLEDGTVIDGKNKQDRFVLEFKDIISSWLKINHKLEMGYYKFLWCFYIDSRLNINNVLISVYTPLPFNNNCLNLVKGNYGYTIFLTTIGFFNVSKHDQDLAYISMFSLITRRLRDILDHKLSKSIINLRTSTYYN